MPIFTGKQEREAGTIFALVTQGLKISTDKGKNIVKYTRTLMKDYENHPAEALKEIPMNLKGNEKYFGSFVLGNYYAPLFVEMNTQEVETFLSGIAELLKIPDDKEIEILDYLADEVMGKMVEAKMSLSEISTKMSDSKFNITEKNYMFFAYGLNFMYGKIT